MPQPLIADLPLNVTLADGYSIRVTALDAATGATVSGVTVSGVVITALDVNTGNVVAGEPGAGPLEPIFEMPGPGT